MSHAQPQRLTSSAYYYPPLAERIEDAKTQLTNAVEATLSETGKFGWNLKAVTYVDESIAKDHSHIRWDIVLEVPIQVYKQTQMIRASVFDWNETGLYRNAAALEVVLRAMKKVRPVDLIQHCRYKLALGSA